MQLTPALQNVKRPRTGPRNRTFQKLLPNSPHLFPVQPVAERTIADSLRIQYRLNLSSKFLPHPMLKGQGEATLGTVYDLVGQRSGQSAN